MIRNYFKIAIRNLLKNKVFSFINVGGLAVGMAVAMLIGLWIKYEFGFEKEHLNRSQIYRAMINGYDSNTGEKFSGMATPLPLYKASKALIPEIKYTAVVNWGGKNGLVVGDKKLIKNGTEVSEDFFKIFKYKFIVGDPNTALNDPNAIVLTKTTAKNLFGDKEAMNQLVRWNNSDNLKVTGIIEDIPKNSNFGERQYFMSFKHFENKQNWVKQANTDWGNYSFVTYIELTHGVTQNQVLPKLKNIIKTNDKNAKNEIGLHAMDKWRLYSEFENWNASTGRIVYVKMFGIIGIIVLLLACINFMNLSTAQSEKRAKEVGIRKAIGSVRKQLIIQFLTESILMAALAMLLSIFLLIGLLISFNKILQTEVAIPYSNPIFWGIVLLLVAVTGILAGLYPAFYMSSFSSIKALKGRFKIVKSIISPRKILVITQFVASITLIIGTIIIYKQIQFTQERPMGYNPNNVMIVEMKDDLSKNYEIIKNEMIASGVVENVTKSSSPISYIGANTTLDDFPGRVGDDQISVGDIAISGDYFKTMQIKIIKGRNFNQLNLDADSNKVILNEAAVERMHIANPIGKMIREKRSGKRQEIIGVAQNTIMANPFEKVNPARFLCNQYWASTIMFRTKNNVSPNKVISAISPIFNKYNPSFPFEYTFVNDEYGKKFAFEVVVSKLATFFAILAIFISCLGLFGLASFVAEQRTKEIGIRKVLGASVTNLWQLLSKDFLVLVIISCLIAAPIAYYLMLNWLQKYTYRTEISWWIFVTAGIGSLAITILTVSYQAIKAAMMNPVKSLKTE